MSDHPNRQQEALGATPGICRSLNATRTFMCDLPAGHDGMHNGFELPTITIDEGPESWDEGYLAGWFDGAHNTRPDRRNPYRGDPYGV